MKKRIRTKVFISFHYRLHSIFKIKYLSSSYCFTFCRFAKSYNLISFSLFLILSTFLKTSDTYYIRLLINDLFSLNRYNIKTNENLFIIIFINFSLFLILSIF